MPQKRQGGAIRPMRLGALAMEQFIHTISATLLDPEVKLASKLSSIQTDLYVPPIQGDGNGTIFSALEDGADRLGQPRSTRSTRDHRSAHHIHWRWSRFCSASGHRPPTGVKFGDSLSSCRACGYLPVPYGSRRRSVLAGRPIRGHGIRVPPLGRWQPAMVRSG